MPEQSQSPLTSRRHVLAAGAGTAAALAAGAVAAGGSAAAASPVGSRTGLVGTWACVPTAVPPTPPTVLRDQTVRQVLRTSIGGDAPRIRLSNEFGSQPLVIGEARVALRAGGAGTDIVPRTDRRLTFGGRASVSVPVGVPMLSDPVALRLPPAADLVVSIYLPQPTPVTTVHGFSFQDNVVAAGNVTGARSVVATSTMTEWFFLSGVSLRAASKAGAIVALGDSITDGANTTTNADRRWPDQFAQRLRAAHGLPHSPGAGSTHPAGKTLGVLNLGIAGNRLLWDPNPPPGSDAVTFAALFGQSAVRRFDRDVLAQPGVGYVIVLLGVNDLGHPGSIAPLSETVSAADVIGGYGQLIARAHSAGVRIFGGTILPFKDTTFGYWNEANEQKRQAANEWIRTSGEFDGVVDFDAAVRDPADPLRMRADYDSGDHLHPNDAGAAAMAAAVPLRFFQ